MESAAIIVVCGTAMIVLGLRRGLWQSVVNNAADLITNFELSIRGLLLRIHPTGDPFSERQPFVALLGAALVLLGIWLFRFL